MRVYAEPIPADQCDPGEDGVALGQGYLGARVFRYAFGEGYGVVFDSVADDAPLFEEGFGFGVLPVIQTDGDAIAPEALELADAANVALTALAEGRSTEVAAELARAFLRVSAPESLNYAKRWAAAYRALALGEV